MAHRKSNSDAALIAGWFFPSIELIGGVATGAIIFVGGSLVLNEQLSVFTLLTFILYIDEFFFPIRMLAQRYNQFQAVMAAGTKIFTLLDTPIDIKDDPDAVELPTIQGHVKFTNVYFRYNQEEENFILKNINLEVPAGQTVAFVGHTGAGKSSIVKLISRFYDLTDGSLTIDGYEVNKVTQNSLRRQMGIVLQETHLFSGDVMENIRYGRLNATDEEVIEAAKAVGAHDFIMELPDGYATVVGERGVKLSGGQRQRVAIARTLALQPDLLLMDEPFNSLDATTRERLQDTILALRRELNMTTVIVTHALDEAAVLGSKILCLGDPPNCTPVIIENPAAEKPDYRTRPAYLDMRNELRQRMGLDA
ncbi:MAG: ABC transporter ATP-binding protein [Anaerolineae bacterium]|nr:ABC transporter ATP-binding protein [Anaerolineae bacterium]